MLTLTENAADAVRTIVSQTPDAQTAGLRIQGTSSSPDGYALTLAPSPTPGDAVVETGDARVFLEQDAADELDDKVLDAQVTDEGVRFALAVQQ
ncbi:Fe-S cluster assembly protein HesB [Microbacterium stercoris]|uniref:Fe-S cluster assembly protein HesB n=1 Tax=Microbacterium stercoris TaxID=2820289 RepID=A0A939QQX5_9MICO|nr:Fe-S cluster assembly protein HesB [Microbacterium stercoris]MBO3663861.1 Fe-S cluster assembly protein HesB [Microbacterium stercoris]